MASQFIFSDWIEQTKGNFNFAWYAKVQFLDIVVLFNGQISMIVILPSKFRVNSSKRASFEVVEVAFTELWTVQTRPTTWISCPNILVFLLTTASWERRIYVEWLPYLRTSLPSTIETSKQDRWLIIGVTMVLISRVSSHFFEEEVDTAVVIILVNSAESRVDSLISELVRPTAFLETLSPMAL